MIGGWVQGTNNTWTSEWNILLNDRYSDVFIGWMGFSATLAGILGGIAAGLLGDHLFRRRFKLLLLLMMALGIGRRGSLAVFLVWFTLSLPSVISDEPVIPGNRWTVLVSATAGAFFLGAANPIFYELGVEMTYPVVPH